MDTVRLGERIRQLRKARGWKQEALALASDLANASAVSKIEKGQVDPPFSTLVALAKALGVPVSILCGEEPPGIVSVSAREIEELYTTSQSLATRLAALRPAAALGES